MEEGTDGFSISNVYLEYKSTIKYRNVDSCTDDSLEGSFIKKTFR